MRNVQIPLHLFMEIYMYFLSKDLSEEDKNIMKDRIIKSLEDKYTSIENRDKYSKKKGY